jgi:hypothetical protein
MLRPVDSRHQQPELHGLPQRYRGVRALWVSAVSGSIYGRVHERLDVFQRGSLLCQPRNEYFLLAGAVSLNELPNSALRHVHRMLYARRHVWPTHGARRRFGYHGVQRAFKRGRRFWQPVLKPMRQGQGEGTPR